MPDKLPRDAGQNLSQFVAANRIKTKAIVVGTSAVLLETSSGAARITLMFQNLSGGTCYIGGSDVTTANGLKVPNGVPMALDCFSQCPVYIIADAAAQDVRVAEVI